MVTDGDDDGGGYLDDDGMVLLPHLFSDSFSDPPSLVVSVGAASSRSTTMASLPPTLAVRPCWRRPDPRRDRTCLCSLGEARHGAARQGQVRPFPSLHSMQLILGLYVLCWSTLHSNYFLCYIMRLMFLKYVFSIMVQNTCLGTTITTAPSIK